MNLDKMRIAELEQENKRLALQVEVLSAAFANSSEKEKELMAEKAEMLRLINAMLAAEKESNGICDCIDNNGNSYQSAFLLGVLSQMEIIASKNKSAQS